MKVEVNISKRYFLSILSVFIIVAGVIGVIAYNSGGPASVFGHSGEEIEVDVGSSTVSLQQAIDDDLLGGGGSGSLRVVQTSLITELREGNTYDNVGVSGGDIDISSLDIDDDDAAGGDAYDDGTLTLTVAGGAIETDISKYVSITLYTEGSTRASKIAMSCVASPAEAGVHSSTNNNGALNTDTTSTNSLNGVQGVQSVGTNTDRIRFTCYGAPVQGIPNSNNQFVEKVKFTFVSVN